MDSRSNKIFWLPRIGEGLRHLWIFFFEVVDAHLFLSLSIRRTWKSTVLWPGKAARLVWKKSVLQFNYMEEISFSNIVLFLVTSISLVYFAACKKKMALLSLLKKCVAEYSMLDHCGELLMGTYP